MHACLAKERYGLKSLPPLRHARSRRMSTNHVDHRSVPKQTLLSGVRCHHVWGFHSSQTHGCGDVTSATDHLPVETLRWRLVSPARPTQIGCSRSTQSWIPRNMHDSTNECAFGTFCCFFFRTWLLWISSPTCYNRNWSSTSGPSCKVSRGPVRASQDFVHRPSCFTWDLIRYTRGQRYITYITTT